MEAIIFLSIIIALFSIFISYLVIRRVKKQIAEITDALADVKNGNGNRRILSATNELVAPLAYEINEINYILECWRYGSAWNKNGLGTNDRTYPLNISSCNDTWNYGDYFIWVD